MFALTVAISVEVMIFVLCPLVLLSQEGRKDQSHTMGDTLSKPVTDKHTSTFETTHLNVGCCGMQGWRKSMEDAHVAQLNLEGDRTQALFGVFDGHNGHLVAKYAGAHIVDTLVSTHAYGDKAYDAAFVETFEKLDSTLDANQELRNEGGCTAVSVLLTASQVICANAGDSRAVLCRNGTALPLSSDHKPSLAAEIARIEKAGGCVQNNRVNGTLALSRAIGDFEFKENTELPWDQQMITALPDITINEIGSGDSFIVLACDGVWDVLSNQQCCDAIKDGLQQTQGDVGLVCEMVLDRCLAKEAPGIGCDNMTIIIVVLKPAFFGSSTSS